MPEADWNGPVMVFVTASWKSVSARAPPLPLRARPRPASWRPTPAPPCPCAISDGDTWLPLLWLNASVYTLSSGVVAACATAPTSALSCEC